MKINYILYNNTFKLSNSLKLAILFASIFNSSKLGNLGNTSLSSRFCLMVNLSKFFKSINSATLKILNHYELISFSFKFSSFSRGMLPTPYRFFSLFFWRSINSS